MGQKLPQNRAGQLCIITKWDKGYYNVKQVIYYKVLLLQNDNRYYKIGQVYYKVEQVLQIGVTAITKLRK